MAQAIVDPQELRQFALMLKRFNASLSESSTRISQEIGRLGNSWRDQEHQKFASEFENDLKVLSRIVDSCEKHVPYLLRKAELIEQYQQGG